MKMTTLRMTAMARALTPPPSMAQRNTFLTRKMKPGTANEPSLIHYRKVRKF